MLNPMTVIAQVDASGMGLRGSGGKPGGRGEPNPGSTLIGLVVGELGYGRSSEGVSSNPVRTLAQDAETSQGPITLRIPCNRDVIGAVCCWAIALKT